MVLGRSIKQFDRLGSAIKEAQTSTRNITAFQKLRRDLSQAEAAFQQARDRLAALRLEMQNTARPTRQMRANLAQAHKEAHRLGQRLDQQRQALMQQRRAMQAAGQSTAGLTAQKKRLANTVGQLRRQYDRLGEALKRRDAVLQKRAALRSQLVDTVALGAAIAAPVRAAMQFESVMADVRKVVNFDSPEQFRRMQKDLLKLSTVIPMSAAGLGEIMAAAGQAGIARDELRRFTADAAKMGVAFDMTGADAGSAMTGLRSIFKLNQPEVIALGDAYNHLSNNMDATARDMLKIANRTGSTGDLFGLTGQQVTVSTAEYDRLGCSLAWRWPSHARLNRRPALQYQGPASVTITLTGAIHVETSADLGVTEAMQKETDKGQPRPRTTPAPTPTGPDPDPDPDPARHPCARAGGRY